MTMQEYLSIFSDFQGKEALPLIFAGILGLAIVIIFYLLIRIQGAINQSKIENNKLLEMVKAVNESSQNLVTETTQASTDINSAYNTLKTQVESLIQSSTTFRGDFDQLQAAYQDSVSAASHREEVLSDLVESNIQRQSEKLQTLEEKLEKLAQVTNQVESLEKKSSNLENILVKLQETNKNSQEIIASLASNTVNYNPEETLKSLKTLDEKLTKLESDKTQAEALVQTTADEVEARIKKLLEAKKTTAKSPKKGMSPRK